MSNNFIDYLYCNYRNLYYSYNEEIQNEINNLIDNGVCSVKYNILNYYSVIGVSSIYFIKIIPNLFRKCYINSNLLIPNICPSIVQNSEINYYLPNLIEEKYIKSFLYYNFPCNITDIYTIQKLIKNIKSSNIILGLKKKNETYSSYSKSTTLFGLLYSDNSMLVQLLSLYNFINKSNNFTKNSLIGCNFKIKWDCTLSCNCYNNDTYIVGNKDNSLILNYIDGSTLYNLYYNTYNIEILNEYNNDDSNINNVNILTILKYAVDVYQQILIQIEYYLESKTYCLLDYMLSSNVPILFSLYNNYYNNQLKTNSKELTNSNINSVVPIKISIESYVNSFITIYFKTYPSNYLLKTVYLNNLYALVFISTNNNSSTIVISDYIYYFISINYPSPIQIYNGWTSTTYYNNIDNFVNDFLIYYENYLGSSNTVLEDNYVDGGLYPNLGETSDSENIGYLYFFYNSDNILIGVAYLALETDSTVTPLGYGLALDFNDYIIL